MVHWGHCIVMMLISGAAIAAPETNIKQNNDP
ncbi:SinH-like protein [Escherichia marmotae]|nr:SinH-like protein [Escherichia marmotae]